MQGSSRRRGWLVSGASPGSSPTRDASTRPSACSTTGARGAASTKFRHASRVSASTPGSNGWAPRGTTGYRRHLPDALRPRRHARHRRLLGQGRRSVHRRLLLRASRRQARPHRGQARARAPALLLRRRPARRDRRDCPAAPAPLARIGRSRVARDEGVPPLLEPAAPAAAQLLEDDGPESDTRPVPCDHCAVLRVRRRL